MSSKVTVDSEGGQPIGGSILDSDGQASGSAIDLGDVGRNCGLVWDVGGRTVVLV
jgi:hypothetical protein